MELLPPFLRLGLAPRDVEIDDALSGSREEAVEVGRHRPGLAPHAFGAVDDERLGVGEPALAREAPAGQALRKEPPPRLWRCLLASRQQFAQHVLGLCDEEGVRSRAPGVQLESEGQLAVG